MKKIKVIVAMDKNKIIGNKGDMPDWDIYLDRAFFKSMTLGNPVILGRKNYESLPPQWQPLPNRTNIVLTKNQLWDPKNTEVGVAHSLWDALQKAEEAPGDIIWGIGGNDIYELLFQHVLIDEVYVTEIDGVFEGDIRFTYPYLHLFDKIEKVQEILKDVKNSHNATIWKYSRIHG